MERILNGVPGTMSCWKRFGTMTASAFSETPFDRKPPLTKNYSHNSLKSPKAFEKTTALRVFFFSSQRKTIGKKVGDVQAVVAATDILGRGKDIKRSARDYVLLEAIRYHDGISLLRNAF